jgi:hypothetical protein
MCRLQKTIWLERQVVATARAWYLIANTWDHGFLRFSFACEMNQARPIVNDGITKEEDEFIRTIWSLMSEDKSYYDAILAIAGG